MTDPDDRPDPAHPAVRLVGAGRRFGAVTALHPLDLDIAAGASVALIGHNGSGKSTLLQLVAGHLRPSEGRVEVEGHDLTTATGRQHARRHVAVGGATGAFYPDLTVAEHLELVAIAHELNDAADRVESMLVQQGLDARRDALPAQLSTGMRQKLDLALAFLRPTGLLLLDEPDRGLDPAAREALWTEVASRREAGTTLLLASHHPAELEHLVDEVLLLEFGEVLERGPLDEIRRTEAARRLGLT
ncbi:MAG: ABC transporter ATP-binding protein [Nitriliruptoraceae bacterium]